MIKRWVVRLELARDDDGALGSEEIEALSHALGEGHAHPMMSLGGSGAVVVQLTLDARDLMAARSGAEQALRDAANTVWRASGLPPFTIVFTDATEDSP
jgi:hypothetical protein